MSAPIMDRRRRSIQLNPGDVHLSAGPHVRCLGKGRKERCNPRWTSRRSLSCGTWLATTSGHDSHLLFPSRPAKDG